MGKLYHAYSKCGRGALVAWYFEAISNTSRACSGRFTHYAHMHLVAPNTQAHFAHEDGVLREGPIMIGNGGHV